MKCFSIRDAPANTAKLGTFIDLVWSEKPTLILYFSLKILYLRDDVFIFAG